MKTPCPALLAGVASVALLIVGAACHRSPPAGRRALLESYLSCWNTGNTAGAEAILDPNYEMRYAPDFVPSVTGIAAFRREMTRMRGLAFSVTMDEAIFGPDTITLRWTCSATYPASESRAAQTVRAHGLSLIHLKNGRIADEWIAYDRQQWMEQLGFEMKPK